MPACALCTVAAISTTDARSVPSPLPARMTASAASRAAASASLVISRLSAIEPSPSPPPRISSVSWGAARAGRAQAAGGAPQQGKGG